MNPDSLYAIDARLREIIDRCVDPETGELSPEFEGEIDRLHTRRDAKILAWGHVIKRMMYDADALEARAKPFAAEAAALRERKRVAENTAKRMLARLEGLMTVDEKHADDTVALSWRQSTRVLVDDGANVEEWPVEYRKSEARLTELRKASESGEKLPPGVVVDTRKRLSIK